MTEKPDVQFGSPDCTCIPWTRQDGAPRYCGPGDTVDMISGWERRRDCPHHTPAPAAAHPGPCGQHCEHQAETEADPLREQYAAAMAELDCAKFNCPVPDKDHEYWRIWYAQTDAVLGVRDTELQQLREQVNAWRRKAIRRAIRLGRHESTLAAIREFAAEEVTARNSWGDGYRDAKRDLTELIDTLAPTALDQQE